MTYQIRNSEQLAKNMLVMRRDEKMISLIYQEDKAKAKYGYNCMFF